MPATTLTSSTPIPDGFGANAAARNAWANAQAAAAKLPTTLDPAFPYRCLPFPVSLIKQA